MVGLVGHVAYHYFRAAQIGQPFDVLPELTKEEQLAVAILVSVKEKKRAFPGLDDYALAGWVAPHPSGHAAIWRAQADPYRPNQTDLDTKMDRPARDALTSSALW
jgi:hypothetical protein